MVSVSRRFAVLLAVIALLATGCGAAAPDEVPEGAGQTQGEEASPDEAAATGAEVSVRFTSWRTDDVAFWEEILEEFHAQTDGIRVEFTPVTATEYDTVLRTRLQSDSAEELIFVRSWDVGRTLFDGGFLEPLTDEQVPNLSSFPDAQLDSWRTEDGTVYAVPANWVAFGALYNQAIFDDAGVEPPATLDELLDACTALRDHGVIPIAGGSLEPWTLEHMLSDHLLPMFYDGANGHRQLLDGELLPESEPFIAHLEYLLELRDACWPDGYEGIGYADTQQLFASEQAAMFMAGSWEIAVMEEQNPDLQMGYFPTPVRNAGDQQWLAMTPAGAYGVNAAATPEQKEAAVTFINWLSGPEGGQLTADLLVGQFPASPDAPLPDHPIAAEWIGQQGDQGENLTVWWTFQGINAQEPGAQSLAWEALQEMMNGSSTPEQAAQKIQEGVASWYESWQR